MAEDPMLEIADGLYALPLAEFTPARDALVREHRADKELAARVKALRKPSVGAWVVNLLVRREHAQVEQVLGVGEALRQAQAQLDGEELRALTRQRRQLTAAVTSQARTLAHDAGQRVTESVRDQVEATLTAAMLDEGAADAVRSGLLVVTLSATGVDAVDVAAAVALPEALGFAATPREAPAAERPQLHVVPDPDPEGRAREEAQERVAAAEAALAEAAEHASAADDDVTDLNARALQLGSELAELRNTVAQLEAEAEDVDEQLTDAEDVAAEARTARAEAQAELDRARAALDRLTSPYT